VWRGSNGTVAPPRAGSVGRDVSPPLVSAVVGPIDTVPSPVSVRKPPRFRGKSWTASPIAYRSETPILQDFLGTLGIPRSACHAEGPGFESLQPLPRRSAFAGLWWAAFPAPDGDHPVADVEPLIDLLVKIVEDLDGPSDQPRPRGRGRRRVCQADRGLRSSRRHLRSAPRRCRPPAPSRAGASRVRGSPAHLLFPPRRL
jgi:hypothetical protein